MSNNHTTPLRRAHHRFLVDGVATICAGKNAEKVLILKNLCPRGVSVVTNYPMTINEKITVVIDIPAFKEPIRKKAKIVWCNKINGNSWQIGLDFGLNNKLDFSRGWPL